MEIVKPRFAFFSRGILFLKAQQHDWKVTVARTSLERFSYQMLFPYLSLYIVALGATATQLGIVNSVGMVIAGIFGPILGWFIDRKGPKRIYLLGISLVAVAYFIYGIAGVWTVTILAMIAYWLGFSTALQSCATICGNCLANKDRATGMTICETVAAGLLGMAGPMLGVWLVTSFGGVNTSGIRPLFFVGLTVTIGTFFIVLTLLTNQKWGIAIARPNLFRDTYLVLKEGRHLKRWIAIASVGFLPLGMVFPFSQVFAHEVKGANELILGAMVTGSALTSIIFSIPLGRLADKIGRKKVLYTTIPLFWLANLILIWAPSPAFLVVAGVLQGFYFIGGPILMAMERELVPADRMGRWVGIVRFFRMLVSAGLAFAAGALWDKIGPQYVFLGFVALDLVVRMPLLIGMPETLHRHLSGETRPA